MPARNARWVTPTGKECMSKRKDSRRSFAYKPSCEELVDRALTRRIKELHILWNAYEKGIEDAANLGKLSEYGYAFDFVVPNARSVSARSYFRYLLSGGGPSDEFRFFAGKEGGHWKPYCIEYWYLDWFDGAKRTVQGLRFDLMQN